MKTDCCHYPKPSTHPSSSVGNQTMKSGWDGNPSTVSYPGKGPTGSRLDTERAKTMVLSGNSSSAPGNDYPGEWSHSKTFGTVKKLSSGS